MVYKLLINKQDINVLKKEYVITDFFFNKYIKLNDYNDFTNIQNLLNKQLLVDSDTNTISILD